LPNRNKMLSAPIDRNKENEPEKQVGRIVSSNWALPLDRELLANRPSKKSKVKKGVVLRVGNRRKQDRRFYEGLDQSGSQDGNRRKDKNRFSSSLWNPVTHDILIVAVEKERSEKDVLKTGERITVQREQKTLSENPFRRMYQPPHIEEKAPLLVKNDEDYVLHLSGKSPHVP
jgi:hypothetical protein